MNALHCWLLQVAKKQLLAEGELMPFHSVVLRLPVSDETRIAPALDKVAQALGSQVSIGSYPVSHSSGKLTVCDPAANKSWAVVKCFLLL